MDKWSHEYVDQLADEVYTNGVDPNNEWLWDNFVLAFVQRFWDTREEERALAQLLNIEMKKDNLDRYITRFESLLRKAGRDCWETANVNIFKQELKCGSSRWSWEEGPSPTS